MGRLQQLVGSAMLAAGLMTTVPAQATLIAASAHLTGPSESPPNASPGVGDAMVILDTSTHLLSVNLVSFSGLLAGTMAAHIHCCVAPPGTAGVATQVPTFAGFPLGVTSGTYAESFDTLAAGTYNPAFITASGGTPAFAEAALAAGLAAGQAYLNIHTTQFPNGEIRGFLIASPTPAPEPGALGLFSVGLVGLMAAARRRRALLSA
jgi:CHRD domain-containing protein/PEP-CTERM motif-containing protein